MVAFHCSRYDDVEIDHVDVADEYQGTKGRFLLALLWSSGGFSSFFKIFHYLFLKTQKCFMPVSTKM